MAVNVRIRKAVTSCAAVCPEKKKGMDSGRGKLADCQSPSFLSEQSSSNKLNSFSYQRTKPNFLSYGRIQLKA